MSTEATKSDPKPKEEAKIEELEFVKIRIPENVRLIPRSLIEAVKGQLFNPDQFYKYQERQIRYENPCNLLFTLVSKEKTIEGYLWAELNALDGTLFVNTFSISKGYWHKGKAMPIVISFLEELKKKHQSPRVFWITTNDKFFTKHNFKRSKNVLMEYNSN